MLVKIREPREFKSKKLSAYDKAELLTERDEEAYKRFLKPPYYLNCEKENKLENVCVQVQLHKIIWNPEARGV